MMNINTKSISFWGGIVSVAFLLFVVFHSLMLHSTSGTSQPSPAEISQPSPDGTETIATDSHQGNGILSSTTINMGGNEENSEERVSKSMQRRDQSLVRLQELLDDEEKHEEALKMALEMVGKSYEQKLAAIDALNWIGGHEAKMGLVSLLQVGGAVTTNSIHALQHLFLEEAQDDSKPFDAEAFYAAIELLEETDRDSLLVILLGYPVEQAAPVVIKLMDSTNEDIRRQAFDSFETIAEGTEVASKAQAEDWLRDYLIHKDEQKGQQE